MSKRVLSNSEKDEYIKELESVIAIYTTDNGARVLLETNKALGSLAKDIAKIANGEEIDEKSILTDNKQNAVFERLMKIIESSDKISKLSDKVKAIFNIESEETADDVSFNIEAFVKRNKRR